MKLQKTQLLMAVFIAFTSSPFLAEAKTAKAKTKKAAPVAAAKKTETPAPVPSKIQGVKSVASIVTFEGVPLTDVTLTYEDQSSLPLVQVSHGLRKKAVFGLVPVNVYVMQLLAAKPENLNKTSDGALASLKSAGPIHMELTFLRNLSGEKIAESFKEGLEANKIDTKNLSPELKKVFDEISAIKEFKTKDTFYLTFSWNGNEATLNTSNPAGKFIAVTGPEAFATQLLSIWFGKPADAKLGELKAALLK